MKTVRFTGNVMAVGTAIEKLHDNGYKVNMPIAAMMFFDKGYVTVDVDEKLVPSRIDDNGCKILDLDQDGGLDNLLQICISEKEERTLSSAKAQIIGEVVDKILSGFLAAATADQTQDTEEETKEEVDLSSYVDHFIMVGANVFFCSGAKVVDGELMLETAIPFVPTISAERVDYVISKRTVETESGKTFHVGTNSIFNKELGFIPIEEQDAEALKAYIKLTNDNDLEVSKVKLHRKSEVEFTLHEMRSIVIKIMEAQEEAVKSMK